jgi:hypothetical protein
MLRQDEQQHLSRCCSLFTSLSSRTWGNLLFLHLKVKFCLCIYLYVCVKKRVGSCSRKFWQNFPLENWWWEEKILSEPPLEKWWSAQKILAEPPLGKLVVSAGNFGRTSPAKPMFRRGNFGRTSPWKINLRNQKFEQNLPLEPGCFRDKDWSSKEKVKLRACSRVKRPKWCQHQAVCCYWRE